jgi:Zn-dependent metalloprotease
MDHRHSISCILPPHILEHIIEQGTAEQRQKASRTARTTSQMRTNRQSEMVPKAPDRSAGPAVLQRRVYTAGNLSSLPGQLVRSEGDPPAADPAVNEAYDGAGATYNLYWEAYQRSSIDNASMPLNSTVHYQQGYDNAFWNGKQMVYGDGDEDLPENQRLFNRFTIAIDVIGHELTHGVTQYTANLDYSGQPGALNESFSDVFGSLVKQRNLGQDAASADWIIGAGLFTANVQGVGIRSMQNPGTAYNDPVLGKDPQPGHIRDYVNTTSDNGGVHINSGIPNKAFYLSAVEIGGNAWEKAGKIWYVTLRDRLKSGTSFQGAADLTFAVAGELFGADSLEQIAVQHGWAGVGITVNVGSSGGDTGGGTGSTNPGCSGALSELLKIFGR